MSIHEFFGVLGFGLFAGTALGGVAGYVLATHIHAVASAASRALTIPQGDVAALNAKVDGLDDKLQAVVQAAAQPVTGVINKLPQPPAAAPAATAPAATA